MLCYPKFISHFFTSHKQKVKGTKKQILTIVSIKRMSDDDCKDKN